MGMTTADRGTRARTGLRRGKCDSESQDVAAAAAVVVVVMLQ